MKMIGEWLEWCGLLHCYSIPPAVPKTAKLRCAPAAALRRYEPSAPKPCQSQSHTKMQLIFCFAAKFTASPAQSKNKVNHKDLTVPVAATINHRLRPQQIAQARTACTKLPQRPHLLKHFQVFAVSCILVLLAARQASLEMNMSIIRIPFSPVRCKRSLAKNTHSPYSPSALSLVDELALFAAPAVFESVNLLKPKNSRPLQSNSRCQVFRVPALRFCCGFWAQQETTHDSQTQTLKPRSHYGLRLPQHRHAMKNLWNVFTPCTPEKRKHTDKSLRTASTSNFCCAASSSRFWISTWHAGFSGFWHCNKK